MIEGRTEVIWTPHLPQNL